MCNAYIIRLKTGHWNTSYITTFAPLIHILSSSVAIMCAINFNCRLYLALFWRVAPRLHQESQFTVKKKAVVKFYNIQMNPD